MGTFGVMGVLRANAKKAYASLGVRCGESGWGDCHSSSFPKGVGGVAGCREGLGVSWVSIGQGGARVGRVYCCGRGGSKARRCGLSWSSLWRVCSVGAGIVGDEWIGSRRFCTEVRSECWWRRRGYTRFASWAGVDG